ncbi:porin [Alteromonas sp. a30]|uniref:porin n=1 Tax=Alteromonas sp. a30 TaxID=2730917 RepID=UPI0022800499|nr:porin [Alteromonas sp. a30]MCY7295923.1 porin [Alteromonas sp. a30]
MNTFKKSLSKATCLIAALGFVASASAEVKLSGFASFVGGKFSEDSYSYLEYDNDFSFSPDTVLGIQLGADLADDIKVTAQLISKGLNDYDVEVELAYLTYSVNPFWDVRVGRLRTPLFYYSDFLDVGYAYPWIRPPSVTYRVDAASFDGMDMLYRTRLGGWDSTFQLVYGADEEENVESNGLYGLTMTFNRDWLTFRLGYISSEVTVFSEELVPIFDGIRAAGFGDVADDFDPGQPRRSRYLAAAMIVDYNDWLVNMEYTQVGWDKSSIFLHDSAWFAMVGRRFGDYTVHLTYSTQEDDPDFEDNTIPLSGVPAGIATLGNVLNAIISNEQQDSLTLGVRYDVAGGVALKAEVTRYSLDIAEPLFPGQQSNVDDGTLFNIGLDIVF